MKFNFSLADFHPLTKIEWPLDKKEMKKGSKLIGVAPFASFQGKVYPLNLIKEVMEELLRDKSHQVFLFGGGVEEERLLNKLEGEFHSNVFNLASKISFKEELAVISNLDVMVSMDSGNGHLAANYGVPVVTVWGVTHPCLGFAPYGQPLENALLADRDEYPLIPTSVYGNKLPDGYENAISTISPTVIAKKVEEILN